MTESITNPLLAAELDEFPPVDYSLEVVQLCYSIDTGTVINRTIDKLLNCVHNNTASSPSQSYNSDKYTKILLRNLNFSVHSGELCALMGSSGAGKSTLLDLLADLKYSGSWSGEVFVNRNPRTKFYNKIRAYVRQDDVHIPTLTVAETIQFAAWSRMPQVTTKNEIQERVSMLLSMMDLSTVRDNLVGDSLHRGISGGQMKRLSIAVEIASLPKIVFLDEPTSGLDSSISLEIMRAVRKLADQRRTCIATIHQPSPEVFQLFDKVVLLSAGRLVYAGSTANALKHFSSPSLGYYYDTRENPAEFLIDVTNGRIFPKDATSARTAEELEKLYTSSTYYEKPAIAVNSAEHVDRTISTAFKEFFVKNKERLHSTSRYTQLMMLMKRTWIAKIRDTEDMKTQVVKNVVIGLLIGVVFFQQANASSPLFAHGVPTAQVSNISALLFFGITYELIGNVESIPALCSIMHVYRRELDANAYSASPFWLSQIIVPLPFMAIYHLIFTAIAFLLTGFPLDIEYYTYFYCVMMMVFLASYLLAMSLAAWTKSEELSFIIFPICNLFLSMFAGFAITIDQVPPLWSWATYVSFSRWGFEGLMVNQWERFDDDDAVNPYFENGNGDVLAIYDFNNYNKYFSYWIMLMYVGFNALLVYIALRPQVKNLKKVNSITKATDSVHSYDSVVRDSNSASLNSYNSSRNAYHVLSTVDNDPEMNDVSDVAVVAEPKMASTKAKGCRLVFNKLSYSVKNKYDNNSITILDSITGCANPGEICALMGASGAGKSTLLDVLADRKTMGTVTGDILFNGRPRQRSTIRNTAYVMQDDVHISALSVQESLYFAAQLRLQETMTIEEKQQRVAMILEMLAISHVADNTIGTPEKRGISGGQLKRLSIGVEIIHLPDIIFLDEPTTGLDSSTAYEVMSAVRNLANQNRTVITTIHQPSALTYGLFDKLLLLGMGKVLYYGQAIDAVKFFKQSIFQFPFIDGSNPADYVIAVAGLFIPAASGKLVTAPELVDYYEQSEQKKKYLNEDNSVIVEELASDDDTTNSSGWKEYSADVQKGVLNANSNCNTSLYHQIITLCHRTIVVAKRKYNFQLMTFLRHLIIGLFYGSLYFQMDTGTDPSVYFNRLALIYFSLTFAIVGQQASIPVLIGNRLVFYRERGSNAYGVTAYWFSLWFLELPIIAINMFIYAVIVYYMSGMRSSFNSFLIFYVGLLLVAWTGLFSSLIVACLASSVQIAMGLFPVSLFFATAFAGYMVFIPQFPIWLRCWAPYSSFMRFGFQALTLNEFDSNDSLPDYQEYLNQLGFNGVTVTGCILALAVYVGVYCLGLLVTLKYVDFEER